jgi:predicted Zn-dependent peptidase
MRLVLPTGTGDERANARGIATIAAHSIEPAFDADMFRFMQSGGRVDADVGLDETAFSVRGLAANIDILLSGLAATVREGTYTDENVRDAMTSQQLRSNTNRDDDLASEVWREALFGAHPYRYAGQRAHAKRGPFELTTLEAFRSQHYRPRGATLIVAGRFDPAVADRWVDHYFNDWAGAPVPRDDRDATLRPLAFAQKQASSQITVQIAFEAPTTHDATLRVLVEMIEGAIADVREQIAASYGLQVIAVRRRALTTIEVTGFVDAARAGEALALLRDQLARLRERTDDTASRFVSARRRVLGQLGSVDTTASALADLTSDDVAKWGDSMKNTAALTLDQIAPLLGKLELTNAAILLRGPERAVRDAYTAIGREPSVVD